MLTDHVHAPEVLPHAAHGFTPYPEETIRRRIDACPKLPSLQSMNQALRDLVHSEQSLNSRIADIIRRDPSLSERLLRLVNSVYFGLSARVNNIEEAVFYLGLRQIRELAMATPVLDDPAQLQPGASAALPWRDLWTHSIGTAMLTREILSSTPLFIDDDTDYLVGLLHNIGKVIMAQAFPDELCALVKMEASSPAEFSRLERTVIGWDHAEIGAYYISRHQLSDEIVAAVRYHNDPDEAPQHGLFAAAVQVADHMARHAGISGGFEQVAPVVAGAWEDLPGWRILQNPDLAPAGFANLSLAKSIERLPAIVEGLL